MVGSNGKNNGITLPSAAAQELAIRTAYEHSGPLNYESVAYVECHGTGTPTGDPIETTAIANVFASGRDWHNPPYIGSTKPQVGHGEAGSALTSVIKVVLSMENGIIPGTIGIQKLNPKLDLRGSRLSVVNKNIPWPADRAKRASVNSTGYGGANGHVVLESLDEYLKDIDLKRLPSRLTFDPHSSILQDLFLLPVCAHDEYSLTKNVENILQVVEKSTYDIHELLYTMTQRRSKFAHRAVLPITISDNTPVTVGEPLTGRANLSVPTVAFVFTGQGAQWAGMGRELLSQYPSVRGTFRKLNNALSQLNEAPSWTIQAEDAIIAAYLRGLHATLTQEPGAMMAVAMGAADAEKFLAEQGIVPEDAVVACINSPESITLSGNPNAIDTIQGVLRSRSILSKKLSTGGKAYHSLRMKEVGSGYGEAVLRATTQPQMTNGVKSQTSTNGIKNHGGLNGHSNGVNGAAKSSSALSRMKAQKTTSASPVMISSVTLQALKATDIDGNYWQKNLESPVLFNPAMKSLLGLKFGPEDRHVDCLIEIGRNHNAEEDMMKLATSIFIKGYPINMLHVNGQNSYRPAKPLVGLPMYPWNHTTPQPLLLNRITKDYKFATHPRHDLIGSRLPGGNRMEPIWRNNLRLKDVPWIQDHVIGNTVIVPGAAYIAMAVEAAAQFAEDDELGGPSFDFNDARFHLHTVAVKSALVIPASGTADIMINLKPTDASATHNRFDFKICSVTDSRWTEHAEGSISYELTRGTRAIASNFAGETEEPIFQEKIGKDAWYDRLKYRGFDFGPYFRVIDEIEVLPYQSRARAKAPILLTRDKDTPFESRYAIHPLTIDAVLQGRVVAVYDSRAEKEEATQIPVFVEDMVINPASWAKNQTGIIDSVAWTEGARTGGSHSTLTTEDGVEIISTKRVKWRQFENQGSQEKMTVSLAREPYYRLHWKPDVDFLDSEKATRLYHSDFQSPSGAAYLDEVFHIRTRLETVTVLYICEALAHVKKEELPTDPSLRWVHGYYNWLTYVRDQAANGRMVLCDSDATQLSADQRVSRIEQLLSELPGDFPQLEYNAIIRKNMAGILNGSVSGVDLAVKAEILARVYADGSIHDAARKNLASVVDILAHKNPTMRVLEVGAGTGSCTSVALEVLNTYDKLTGHAKRYTDYTFTDISPSFFEKAEELFGEYPALIFKTFDLEHDPANQGFNYGEYDLILASNVIHAPGNTDRLLKNCRKLLKPGGKVVMLEITQTESLTPVQFAFGTLPSFWGCLEDADGDRALGPFRTLPSWEGQLLKSGFSGLDLILRDFPDPLALESIMVSTAVEESTVVKASVPALDPVVIVHSAAQNELAIAVARIIGESGTKVSHCSLTELPGLAANGQLHTYIVLEELESPVLMDMKPQQFDGLQKLVHTAAVILWVTGGDLMVGGNPALAMAHGINTTLMNENSAKNLRFAVFDLDKTVSSEILSIANHIVDITSKVCKAASREECETDFMLKDGVIYVSRVVPDMQLNEEFMLDSGDGRVDQDFPTCGNVLLALETPGLLDTIYFQETVSCATELGADEIEIETKAVGLNMKDYVIAMGNFESVKSSNESTGIVSRVGANVNGFVAGDKVICLERGYYDTFLRSPANKCLKLSDDEDLEQMATVGIAHGTALYALKYLAQLEPEESVLIQAATGGLGLAAIQGVDVVLSTISGPGFHESLSCLAPCGRLIDVGRGNVLDKGKMALHVFDKMKPIKIDKAFHITEMESALRYFGQGQHIGKVVLTYGPTENKVKLKGVLKPKGINANNSYLLAGCHGGLGHSMADSLIRHGARNLVFLSRSSEQKREIASFVARAREQGVNVVTIQGDVTKVADVERAVRQAVCMGPLKGVVHAAMVLQDAFFDTMNLEKFNIAVRPKVFGALNLHNATIEADADLDFFFMTSSTVTYVGHISQSNYAAANAVLDNLARKRREMGLPATTISLGPIKGVGTLNRKPEYAENLLRSGLIEAPESEFIYHFERLIKEQPDSKHFDRNTQAHILTGVEYTKHDLSMVQVSRIEQDRRSALLVTTLAARKAAVGDGNAAADTNGDEIPEIPEDRNKAIIVLADAVARRLAKLLFISSDDIDITRPLSHFGIDSMSGSEMIHWLRQKFSVGMSFLEMLDPGCTSKHLAGVIYDTAQKAKTAAVPVTNGVNGTSHATSNGVNGHTPSEKPQAASEEYVNLLGSHMEEFSKTLKKAVSGPKPVANSYVCSVIDKAGTQLYSQAEGFISHDSSKEVGFDSVYWIASMTKLITTVAFMICVERGQVALDDDVLPILPDLCLLPVLDGVDNVGRYRVKKRTKPITFRSLLTHQSGCGYHSSPRLTKWAKENDRKESVFDNDFEVMKSFPLMFEPEEGWMYGSGVDWAGEAIARLNNTTLEEFMQTNIWEPLGMTSTTFHPDKHPGMLESKVTMYDRDEATGALIPGIAMSRIPAVHECGGHGLWSTPRDWTKFISMLLADGGPILQKSSVDEIFKPQPVVSGELQELLSGPLRPFLRATVDEHAGRIEIALGGPLYVDPIPGKRSAGTLQWSGRPNLFWWIDRSKGVAATTFTQTISQADPRFEELTSTFEKAVYADFGGFLLN
ncbi:hypothetical protein UREG_03086 [Uncinocarpus reesii 1704]|uniref:Carrier domain-containing protein n=1 Tax=Uncinocarpus reesii (strain UAMH 1704) TaxID=336963 RepID=C4JP27_UNCRE|nr:uncharacterized protein UREG_03086 [Uncinocarpus reesii 1704]EEP78241.1 hypothetical protein UREG_03086 [Uncinocarpus reesii 1704]